MTRLTLVTAAAALLMAISGPAFAQGVGATPPSSSPGGATTMPRSDTSGAPAMSTQDSPTAPEKGAAAVTLPGVDKMTPAQIQAQLQSNGFQNIRNFTKQGDGYSATATKNGQPVKLRIEASSGRVTTTND
jgi:hypothetical protein